MKKLLKRIPKSGMYVVLCAIIACILVFTINLRLNAETMGASFGDAAGARVGKLVGSFEALADYQEAYAEGKEEGLSADDTTAAIASKIKELENLEVLVASVKLNDVHSVGNDYAALYLLKGDAVFTVDLSKAEIDEKSDGLYITIPKPEMDLIVDESKIKKVAEYQRKLFNGSSEDGFDAYLNFMTKMVSETKQTMVNYDSLMSVAEASAQKQVTQLANSVTTEKRDVFVRFQEEK